MISKECNTYIRKSSVSHSLNDSFHVIRALVAPATQVESQSPVRGHVGQPDDVEILGDHVTWGRASEHIEV